MEEDRGKAVREKAICIRLSRWIVFGRKGEFVDRPHAQSIVLLEFSTFVPLDVHHLAQMIWMAI